MIKIPNNNPIANLQSGTYIVPQTISLSCELENVELRYFVYSKGEEPDIVDLDTIYNIYKVLKILRYIIKTK